MTRTTLLAAALLTAPTLGLAGPAKMQGFALLDDGATLAVMADLARPDAAETRPLATAVDAIAYRPVTGDLVALSNANGAMYLIDPETGAMTDLDATFVDGAGIAAGLVTDLDFNNKIDAVRAVSGAGVNLVYFPEEFGDEKAGSVRRFTDLAYAEGDASEGTAPQIFANAYTNAIPGAKASSTAQYALDAATDALVTLANNAGTLETVGPITVDGAAVDLLPMGGFDIVSAAEGEDAAYAILQMAGQETASLYRIDLTNGAATPMGNTGRGAFSGFAAKAE